MIEFVFTIDYEIYGNGTGALLELVYEPARRLTEIFRKRDIRFVAFVEAAELEKIEAWGTDPAIDLVKKQVAEFYRHGFEVALHLHPQWCNARYERGAWELDYREYNLCTLPKLRINEIVDASLAYLGDVVGCRQFTPLAFRAGNWLFQPTEAAAGVLADKGIKIDSSVFKGGLLHQHGLDYRRALKNGYFWPFEVDANRPDPLGRWIEIPIHTEMVPVWRMATSKRLGLRKNLGATGSGSRRSLDRLTDFLRFRYPLKLDFCRMGITELTRMLEKIIREDRKNPEVFRPIVAIGHTKDLVDFDTIEALLAFLESNGIPVGTFSSVYPKLAPFVVGAGCAPCKS